MQSTGKYQYFYQKELEKNINKDNYSLSIYHFKNELKNYEVDIERIDRLSLKIKNFKTEEVNTLIELLKEFKWNIVKVKGFNIKDKYMKWNDRRYDIRGAKSYHFDELEIKYFDIELFFSASFHEIKLHEKEILPFYYTYVPKSRWYTHFYHGINLIEQDKDYTSVRKIILYEDELSNVNFNLLKRQFKLITKLQDWIKVRIDTTMILGNYLAVYYDIKNKSYYTNNYLPKPCLSKI